MVIIHSEAAKSKFKGTVIDIETIGHFCEGYQDSRHYQNITPVIFGYVDENGLEICCTKSDKSIEKLKTTIAQVLPDLRKPLYAFNCNFERGVLFHSCGIVINFDGELNKEKFESKKGAVASLGIEDYDDPFDDTGFRCKLAWEKGDTTLSIRHNRSCLLKERDILLTIGHRPPENLILVKKDT